MSAGDFFSGVACRSSDLKHTLMIWLAPDCNRMVGGKPYEFGAVTLTLVLNK